MSVIKVKPEPHLFVAHVGKYHSEHAVLPKYAVNHAVKNHWFLHGDKPSRTEGDIKGRDA